ncbi:phage tail protein [Geobacillus thermodenitrificans]|uniref:phage tail spike protein n=1 Tax=Geobacillus thermodenitrificans TaxID=33940 RepID=UPI003D20CB5F
MLKYNQLRVGRYNLLGKIRYNSQPPQRQQPLYSRLSNALLVVYDQEGKRLGVLENADDPILEQEIGSVDTLTFSLPYNDPKREYIQNENIIEVVNQRYFVRDVSKVRAGGRLELVVYCEATWYDLQYTEPMKVWSWQDATPEQIMADILDGTGWTVGRVEVTERRNLQLEEGLTNRLKALRELPNVFTGELWFNTSNNTVDFLRPEGRDSGASIVYRKNMKEIEVYQSTKDLVTKLYLYGKDNMTIEDAHPQGLPYIENYQYTTKKRVLVAKDERFTNPFHLYERGVYALNILSRPTDSYVMKIAVLSRLSGLSHEEFALGDNVFVYDKELGINEKKRIVRWKYNIKRPWESEVELERPQPTLSDLLTGVQESAPILESEDTVDRQDLLNLSVFNYLLNSRADDGFAYWTNNGWEIDPVNGYSGNASFKAVGEAGVTKEMSQEVFPAHREEYTISFRASAENIALGPNGRVGVYVTIKYEDGTEDEPVFISLIESEGG